MKSQSLLTRYVLLPLVGLIVAVVIVLVALIPYFQNGQFIQIIENARVAWRIFGN